MSVDKFGRHEGAVRARKEARRTLREDIGLHVTEDGGHFNVKNKRILNLGEPVAANDAVPLHYVDGRCLLIPTTHNGTIGAVDVKGNRIINTHTPVDSKDVVNKQYVDATSLLKDQYGNLSVRNHRITDVQDPVLNKDAVNLEFLHFNTVSLQDEVFHAHGRKICNLTGGEVDRDAINLRQLNELKLYTRSEMYKLAMIFKTSINKLWETMYEIHREHSVGAADKLNAPIDISSVTFGEDYSDVARDITVLDKKKEIYDWRYLYVPKDGYKLSTS